MVFIYKISNPHLNLYCSSKRSHYGSVKTRDAINRRLYNNQSFVETPIYRVFVM
ncbi:MAG: hypothetical protein RMX97_23985 [Nostoc sp. DedQUE11]|nr:hypothetical protein [Nostoc sp. DedQUE11]